MQFAWRAIIQVLTRAAARTEGENSLDPHQTE